MRALDDLAHAIGAALPGLHVEKMAAHPAFRFVARAALDAAGGSVAEVVAEVAGRGHLRNAQRPEAVVTARLQQVPEALRMRARVAAEATAVSRREAIASAEGYGRWLARVESLDAEDATEMLREAYAEDPEQIAAALAAFDGALL